MKYRADIDGLRAVAVAAVIANHLPGKYLPNGHLGVDVFFVISGFVITASLVSQTHGSIGRLYANFFSRRVKRLLPALLVFVGLTSGYVLLNDPFPDESIKTGLFSLVGVSNIFLYFNQLDYFAASSKFNAFTHTWSLGVEEQFYLLFPLLLWFGMLRGSGSSSTTRYVVITSAVSVISLLAFIFVHRIDQPASFFLTPMRLWELGAGSLVYVYSQTPGYKIYQKALSAAGPVVFLLLLAVFLVPTENAVTTTIIAIFLTSWILLCSPACVVQRLLSTTLLVFLGKISYSLYLWHWPVITFHAFGLGGFFDTTAGALALMVSLASASYYLVERPLRTRNWSTSKGGEITIGLSASAILILAIFGTQHAAMQSDKPETKERYPDRFVQIPTNLKPHNPTCVIDSKRRRLRPDTYTDCTVRPKNPEAPMTWTMGDSHGGNLQPMLFALHDQVGIGVHLVTTPGVPFPPVGIHASKSILASRTELYARAYEEMRKADLVLLPRLYFKPKGGELLGNFNAWIEKIPALANELSAKGVQLVLFGPLPFFHEIEDIRECSAEDLESCAERRTVLLEKNQPVLSQLEALAANFRNVHVFDPFPVLCPPAEFCYAEYNGVLLFADKHHINRAGSEKLALPFMKFLADEGLWR